MQTSELQLSSGQRIFVREWEPENGNSRGCVLCLHGVESHSEWFEQVARHLACQGLSVCAFDRPGWGRSPGKRGDLAAYAEAVAQVAEMATRLRERCGQVHLAGLSWGGMLALYTALRRGPLFDSLTLIAPGIHALSDPGLLRKTRIAGSILAGSGAADVPLDIKVDDFTGIPEFTRYIAGDECRIKAVSARFCLETLKMRQFIARNMGRRKLLPAQLLLAEHDRIIDNAATRALLHRHLDQVTVYAGARHSLVFEKPREVAMDIARLAEKKRRPAQARQVAIMGAGAVGSAVGGLLALGGHQVTLVARQAHADAVNNAGLVLRVGCGCRIIRDNLGAVTDPAQVGGPADLVILAVKSFDTRSALAQMRPLVGPGTVILSLQNGIANEERIAGAFGDNPVIAGAICAYLRLSGPGEVIWTDDRGGLGGAMFAGDQDRIRRMWQDVMPMSGMQALFLENLSGPGAPWRRVKWSKLMLNVAFNVLSAVTGLTTAAILADRRNGTLAVRALQEGFAVMRGLGIAPVNLPGYPVRHLARLARLPAGIVRRILAAKTAREAGGSSSTSHDLARGRSRTEADDINGAVIRAGQSLGLPTPANQELRGMIGGQSARQDNQ